MTLPPVPALRRPLAATIALTLALLAPASLAQTAAPPRPGDVLEKAEALLGDSPIAAILEAAGPDAREFNDHVVTLANPFFEGRAPGLPGNRIAADYIEFYLKRAGLEPAFAGASARGSAYRQPFETGSTVRVASGSVRLNLGDGPADLAPGKDFTVVGASGSGKATGAPVFVGYSIEGGDSAYESYPEGTNLRGKIAIVLRFEPMNDKGRSRWSKEGWSPSVSLESKLQAAEKRGAVGIILVNPPGADDPRAKALADTGETAGRSLRIPVVMLTPEATERLIRAADPTDANRSLMDFRKAADEQGGVVDLPNATVTIETSIVREPVATDNVGALLPGKGDLKDQYVVIGAHYDHVGYGPTGVEKANQGKLHPGADDNASGTSAMLVLARRLARTYADLPEDADARSILFLAFSAEESGLHGSKHFVNKPPVPLESIKLMINLDMVGRLRTTPPLEIEGESSAEGLYEWVLPFFERAGIETKPGGRVNADSDHYPFYARQVPILFFFTGYHDDYHKPGDIAARINQPGAARLINVTHDIALAAAQRHQPFRFVGPAREKAHTPPPAGAAADDDDEPQPGAVRGAGARFGAMPDYNAEGPGIVLESVSEGSPAEAAGFSPGDRLLKCDGKPIEDLQAWMELLGEHSPGDVVELTLIRDGREKTLKATLGAPQRIR